MTRLEDEPQRLPELFRAVADLDGSREAPLACLMPRLVARRHRRAGSGKSTLTDALVREYRQRQSRPARRRDRRRSLVAVHGRRGARRPRPDDAARDRPDGVRPLDGDARPPRRPRRSACRAVIRVMALIGCDVVIIETVGVGQSEVEVAGVADLVIDRPRAGPGRQRPAAQGRPDGNRRPLRRQQGRQAGRRAAPRARARDAEARRGRALRMRGSIRGRPAGRRHATRSAS